MNCVASVCVLLHENLIPEMRKTLLQLLCKRVLDVLLAFGKYVNEVFRDLSSC